jgi:hypothetical protein
MTENQKLITELDRLHTLYDLYTIDTHVTPWYDMMISSFQRKLKRLEENDGASQDIQNLKNHMHMVNEASKHNALTGRQEQLQLVKKQLDFLKGDVYALAIPSHLISQFRYFERLEYTPVKWSVSNLGVMTLSRKMLLGMTDGDMDFHLFIKKG